METLKLSGMNIGECAARAAEILRAGGVVLYPTDTLYGLGADAFSNEAVAKVYAIKSRETDKPIHCIVSDIEMAEKYAEVNDAARALAKALLPGPLTLILKKNPNLGEGIARDIETIGIRIPAHEFCTALAKEFGKPYTTTSANIAGELPKGSIEEIFTQLGENSEQIDLIVDGGKTSSTVPSTVVDVREEEPVIVREGAISGAEIRRILGLPR